MPVPLGRWAGPGSLARRERFRRTSAAALDAVQPAILAAADREINRAPEGLVAWGQSRWARRPQGQRGPDLAGLANAFAPHNALDAQSLAFRGISPTQYGAEVGAQFGAAVRARPEATAALEAATPYPGGIQFLMGGQRHGTQFQPRGEPVDQAGVVRLYGTLREQGYSDSDIVRYLSREATGDVGERGSVLATTPLLPPAATEAIRKNVPVIGGPLADTAAGLSSPLGLLAAPIVGPAALAAGTLGSIAAGTAAERAGLPQGAVYGAEAVGGFLPGAALSKPAQLIRQAGARTAVTEAPLGLEFARGAPLEGAVREPIGRTAVREAAAGAPAVANRVMTFDEFSAIRGVPSTPPSFPELHRAPGSVSKPSARASSARVQQEMAAWQSQRDGLREEYNLLVSEGTIRPPTRIEQLQRTAQGEGQAAEAARRLLTKQSEAQQAPAVERVAAEGGAVAAPIGPADYLRQRVGPDKIRSSYWYAAELVDGAPTDWATSKINKFSLQRWAQRRGENTPGARYHIFKGSDLLGETSKPASVIAAPEPPRLRPRGRARGPLMSADKISDFEVGRDQVIRQGDRTFVHDTTGTRADLEVTSDAMPPEFATNIAKLNPEQRARMIQEVRSTPFLSQEGKAERLAVMGTEPPRPAAPARLETLTQDAEHAAQAGELLPPIGGGAELSFPQPSALKTVDEIAQDVRASTQNAFGAAARRASRLPPLRSLVDMINPSALTDAPPQSLIDEIGLEKAQTLQSQLIAHARKMDDGNALASALEDQINQKARVVGFMARGGRITSVEGSPAIGDLFENPSRYKLTAAQRDFADQVDALLKDMNDTEKLAGVLKGEVFSGEGKYFPRQVEAVRGVENQRAQVRRLVGSKQGFQKGRYYETEAEGIENGVDYSTNIGARVGTRIRAGMKAVGDKEFADLVKPLGRTLKQPLTGAQIGETGTMIPALGGRAFPRETGIAIMEGLEARPPGSTLRVADAVNNLLRPIQAAGDMSLTGLQLLQGAFRNPGAFAKGTLYLVDGIFRDGRLYGKYLEQNPTWIERWTAGHGLWGSTATEFSIGNARNGLIKNVLQRTLGRFERGFVQGQNVAALEHFKGMVGIEQAVDQERFRRAMQGVFGNLKGETSDEIAASIADKLVGRISSRGLGVKATQRSVETAVAFAPRFYRATFGLLADALQGGMRGAEARRALGSLFVGAVALHIVVAKALGQEPKLDPRQSDFLTVKINGAHVGMGGPIYSLVRTASEAWEHPDRLIVKNMNNPLIRWGRGRLSPVAALMVDTLSGSTFLGQKLDSPGDFLRHLGTSVLPFSAQTAIEEGPTEAGAQFFGLRGYPQSNRERLAEAFQRKYGRPFNPETDYEQARQDPELAGLVGRSSAGQSYDQTLATIAQDLRPFADAFRAGNENAGPKLVEKYSDFKTEAAGAAAQAFKDTDFGAPGTEGGRLLDQLHNMNPTDHLYLDPDSLETDWARFQNDREHLIDQIDALQPGFRQAYENKLRLPAEFADVERQLIAADKARDGLPPKYRNLPPEREREVYEFLDRIDAARKDRLAQGYQSTRKEAIDYLATRWGIDPRIVQWAQVLGSERLRAQNRNPAYVRYLGQHRDVLARFYPSLYPNWVIVALR